MPSVEGVPARKAALTILDSVLRRGTTMDAAAQSVRGLSPPDQGLASAIAGEVLRRLPDLDALIDSATRQRLPDDSKARMVLRMALAQKIGLGTPEHALVSTALPLVDGGPRRLVHGVLGTLLRRGVDPAGPPQLPAEVEDRWRQAWGDDVVEAARRQIASRPALDLSFASDEAAQGLCRRAWRRVAGAQARPPDQRAGDPVARRIRQRRLVGAGPRRVVAGTAHSRRRAKRCSTCVRRPAARRCSWRRRAIG